MRKNFSNLIKKMFQQQSFIKLAIHNKFFLHNNSPFNYFGIANIDSLLQN
jgi:hypothetical protein